MQTPLVLSWQNITVTIPEKGQSRWKMPKKKTILNNVSGNAHNHSLIAIMGVSGSGKTTFLEAISGRLKEKEGFIKLNNTLISNEVVKNISGYVHQDDIFTEALTINEHLRFKAAFILKKQTEIERNAVIKGIISELGLEKQRNSFIWSLSGGEKRRLSLAGELIKNPLILFCDEPTTGLDSYSAIIVVQKLEQIAQSGKLVLTTIHQPSSQLFGYFNSIVLLSAGNLIFQGTRKEASLFFESNNLKCPPTYNPADFYINCLSHMNVRIHTNTENVIVENNVNNLNLENELKKGPFFYELKWLLWRAFLNMRRQKNQHFFTYFILMVEALILAICFDFVSIFDKEAVQNIQGILFFMVSEAVYTNMYAVINVFPEEIPIFVREKELYSLHPYFISKLFSLLPSCLLTSVTYTFIYFVFIGFLSGFHLWLQFTAIIFLVSITSSALGLAFSANFSSVEYVDLVMGSIEFLFMVMSGFWLKLNTVSWLLSWLKYFSPFYYGFETLSHLFWKDVVAMSNNTYILEIDEVIENSHISWQILDIHVLLIFYCLIGISGIWRKL